MTSVKASSRLDFGVIPNGDAFSVPQHPEQPVGPRVIPVRGPAMGDLRAALATVTVHATTGGRTLTVATGLDQQMSTDVGSHAMGIIRVWIPDIASAIPTMTTAKRPTTPAAPPLRQVNFLIGSGRALQCRCDTESDCKSCHEQCVPDGRENTRLFRFLNSHCLFLSFFVSPEKDVFCVTQRIAIEGTKRTGNRKFFRDR